MFFNLQFLLLHMQSNNTIFIVVSEAPANSEVKHIGQCICSILYILMLAFYRIQKKQLKEHSQQNKHKQRLHVHVVIVISKLSDTI